MSLPAQSAHLSNLVDLIVEQILREISAESAGHAANDAAMPTITVIAEPASNRARSHE
jgi:hypothetical protein